jgi:D-aminopeptidase
VCAETWDGYLNDINGAHVRPEHAEAALDAATSGPVAEGSVGGTGMNCYEFKGGNGTASRVVRYGSHAFTVAAFVQANFGSRGELVVAGRHVGALLADDNPQDSGWFATDLGAPPGAGSLIAVIATDAPLLPGQRGPPGDDEFGRMTFIPLGRMGPFYAGVVQAVEEAVLNALVVSDDMVGRDGHRSSRLPIDRLLAILAGGREGSGIIRTAVRLHW